MFRFTLSRAAVGALALSLLALMPSPVAHAAGYQAAYLTSDLPGLAAHQDTHLVNPWGDSFAPGGAHWVADNGTGLSTLYDGTGTPEALVVTIPPPMGKSGPSAPTGSVYNTASGFGGIFLFCTEDGTISSWAGGTSATLKVDNNASGAVYKGMALAASHLYVANFHSGKVEVYDSSYAPVNLGSSAFHDSKVPSGYGPFNVQAIGNALYVTYAAQDAAKFNEIDGRGLGYVDVFNTSGVLQRRLQHGYYMNAPWGVALAPATFGAFSNAVLVGNFGTGWIAAYNKTSGAFLGLLSAPGMNGAPVTVPGLWAINFGTGGSSGDPSTLYFAAGVNNEGSGAFGSIVALP